MTRTLRLGLDGRELAGGVHTGIGRYVIEVLRAISRHGWECVVYGDRETRLDGVPSGVNLHALDARWTQWWDQVCLPRQLLRDRVSVFLSPYYKGPLFAPCPVVLTIHDLFFIHYPGRRRPVYDAAATAFARLYAVRADALITDSEYSKRSIVERLHVDPGKVTVIPISPGAEFQPQSLSEDVRCRYKIDEPYILYVGNFKPHKNLPRLIRAYANLSKALRDTYQLVLAGGDLEHRQALKDLAGGLGVGDRILYTGVIDDPHLPAVYSGCSLFVLPSLVEGFGLPALEAMACGAPVVAANRAAIPEVVDKAAILVDPEDVPAIGEAMAHVLSDRRVAETLRQEGFAQVRKFSSDRTSERVLALLGEVCRA
jgi:glycosyltransferase involved in cell wall biosynthesis